ncbi:hypothetical protein RN001_010378 [Aquatica leii]|uniref:Acyltransferase n=1 Tax=Aquatica leii TaxID=1421715 RepID=A0AAN7P6H1_9COLE|nr:hypothetical protein RN001_010378 [Aquatica leii]
MLLLNGNKVSTGTCKFRFYNAGDIVRSNNNIIIIKNGLICGSEKSLNYVLEDPNGGHIIGLAVGGSREVEYATLKDYHIFLKNRKGFVRVALKNGTSLVPVFSFGAENAFTRIPIPKSLQNWIKEKTGLLIYFYNGQGFFQKWFGLAPKFCQISTIVGKPIEVKKIPNPTAEDIDEVHQKFVAGITELFNEYKYKYLKDPDNTQLVIN